VISKAAFKKLGYRLATNMSFCPNHGVEGLHLKTGFTFRIIIKYFKNDLTIEDYDVSGCLKLLNIVPGNGLDKYNRTVFNAFSFENTNYEQSTTKIFCCSKYSFVSAHYMNPEDMLRLNFIMRSMNEQYMSGLIERPTYDDIKAKYLLIGSFLNITDSS
jgi:hypothetical protein